MTVVMEVMEREDKGWKDLKNILLFRSESDPNFHGKDGPLGVMEGLDYLEISKASFKSKAKQFRTN